MMKIDDCADRRSKAKTVTKKGEGDRGDRRPSSSSHVPVAVLALALTNFTVDSLKASALFDLLVPPLHVVGLGVVLP
jgi:hypothetical protein